MARPELEAQIHARSRNASANVAALKPWSRKTSRPSALRPNPAYLPIATDPLWVAFLSERPPVTATPIPGRTP